MRAILIKEICKEVPNSRALDALNTAMGRGGGNKDNNDVNNDINKTPSNKYGLQKDGTFIASNSKIFGSKVENLANAKNPPSVYLKNRNGHFETKVEKTGNIYQVTKYRDNTPYRRNTITQKAFEYNYRHHI